MNPSPHYKDVYTHLKKLEKGLKELQSVDDKYLHIVQHIRPDESATRVELNHEQLQLLYSSYNELHYTLRQGITVAESCINKVDALLAYRAEMASMPVDSPAKRQRPPATKSHATADPPLPIGAKVAARITRPKKDHPDEWILATIVRYVAEKKRYEVEDEEADDGEDPEATASPPKTYLLPRSNLIPLPTDDQTDFTKDTVVLAMFPNTTCFYRSTVASVQRKKGVREYLLKFADDEDEKGDTPTRRVAARFVLPYPSR